MTDSKVSVTRCSNGPQPDIRSFGESARKLPKINIAVCLPVCEIGHGHHRNRRRWGEGPKTRLPSSSVTLRRGLSASNLRTMRPELQAIEILQKFPSAISLIIALGLRGQPRVGLACLSTLRSTCRLRPEPRSCPATGLATQRDRQCLHGPVGGPPAMTAGGLRPKFPRAVLLHASPRCGSTDRDQYGAVSGRQGRITFPCAYD